MALADKTPSLSNTDITRETYTCETLYKCLGYTIKVITFALDQRVIDVPSATYIHITDPEGREYSNIKKLQDEGYRSFHTIFNNHNSINIKCDEYECLISTKKLTNAFVLRSSTSTFTMGESVRYTDYGAYVTYNMRIPRYFYK